MSYTPEEKLQIVQYSFKYGITNTLEALRLDSKRDISSRTLKRWRKLWKTSTHEGYGTGKLQDLKDKSKRPKHMRQSKVHGSLVLFIQQTRINHPNIGKDKLKVFVDTFTTSWDIPPISTSTIGRIIRRLKETRSIPIYKYSKQVYLDGRSGQVKKRILTKKKPKTRRKGYIPTKPGDLIQLDAITFYLNGVKRYIICGIDLVSRYSFAYAYKSLSSASTKDFFEKLEIVFPYPITRVQTDNGQENHKHFDSLLKSKKITHFWNYPHSPKMNAFIERFNRTVEEEFCNYNLFILRDDITAFNIKLKTYLDFYNYKRPHLGLQQDYGQFTSPVTYLREYHPRGHM